MLDCGRDAGAGRRSRDIADGKPDYPVGELPSHPQVGSGFPKNGGDA